MLQDLGSTNGTYINKFRLSRPGKLVITEMIKIKEVKIRLIYIPDPKIGQNLVKSKIDKIGKSNIIR